MNTLSPRWLTGISIAHLDMLYSTKQRITLMCERLQWRLEIAASTVNGTVIRVHTRTQNNDISATNAKA